MVNVTAETRPPSTRASTALAPSRPVAPAFDRLGAQSGTLTQGFTYTAVSNPTPTLSGISPASGTVAGGTAVTITGTGFLAGAMVSLGGTPAIGVTVVSSTTITATTPAHAAGAADVVVSNAEQHAGTLPNGYTYTSIASLGLVCPPGVQVRPL